MAKTPSLWPNGEVGGERDMVSRGEVGGGVW